MFYIILYYANTEFTSRVQVGQSSSKIIGTYLRLLLDLPILLLRSLLLLLFLPLPLPPLFVFRHRRRRRLGRVGGGVRRGGSSLL